MDKPQQRLEETIPELPDMIKWWHKFAPGHRTNVDNLIKMYKKYGHLERRPKNPGRNQPCTCGSGKKFKKCCEVL